MSDLPPAPATPPSPTPANVAQGKISRLALTSLILGCASLLLGIFISLPAVICGHLARFKILRSRGALTGSSVAFVGLITGYISLYITLLPHFSSNAIANARNAEAKVTTVSIASALHSYYTEYGKYPLDDLDGTPAKSDLLFGAPEAPSNARLFNILRAIDSDETKKYNPRMIVFFDGKTVADAAHPRNGFLPEKAGGPNAGAFFDPWGNEYRVALDTNYDNLISNLPYTDFQNANSPQFGVAVFSLGKDGQLGTKGDNTYEAGNKHSDDILSWK